MPAQHHHHGGQSAAASVNTSISSVNTEPHTTEPTPRRRVPSPPQPLYDAVKPAPEHVASSAAATPAAAPNTPPRAASRASPTNAVGSPVRKNNPYQYNVLGENASPDFAARTSPIPAEPMAPSAGPSTCTNSPTFGGVSPHQMQQRPSFEWGPGGDLPPHPHGSGTPPTGSPVLGSYMAQCYSSAFPPGQLPKPLGQPALPGDGAASKPRREAGSGRRRGRRGGSNSPHNSSTATVAAPASPTTAAPAPAAAAAPAPQPQPAPRAATPPGDDGSAMTRVYRNGRPVPVPTAARAN